jgi:phospho-N-acetylmuramoyl-pentapeptide-transferase
VDSVVWCDSEPPVDAKFFSDKSLNLSGATLLWVIGLGLSVAAIGMDWVNGRSWSETLTLPLLSSAIATGVLGHWAVPLLRALKTGQFIREEGPQAHFKKAGTPTMGGIFFVPTAVAIALLLSGFHANVVAVSVVTLAYAAIGWIDDWQVLRRRSNKGISPRMKLLLQISTAVAFCLWLVSQQGITLPDLTTVALPFGLAIPLGLLFWPLAGFVIVAESNATNLTDGLDGLAAGSCAITLLGLGALLAPNHPELMVFCAALSGGCLGFLMHNRNPARVFMGDTGSLSLGGALAAVAILSNSLFSLFILSLIFFGESLSVIAQVSYYKATKGPDGVGRRLFKMAPFHHHLELSGWSELQIVAVFYFVSAALVVLSMAMV